MQYLESFQLPTQDQEYSYLLRLKRPLLTTYYPFNLFRHLEMPMLEFEPITILCGGNGSGKSTILNTIAEKLNLRRSAVFNRTELFEDYVNLCRYQLCYGAAIPKGSRIITSDDVFDYLLDIRNINNGIDNKRGELFQTYFDYRKIDNDDPQLRLQSLEDYDRWREIADARGSKKPRPSAYIRDRVMENIREHSNGESALMVFTEEIRESALYLLDEPENSLSAEFQEELKTFLIGSARSFACQFIISTHSPILLSIPGAKIYDLDADPPCTKSWTELKNVRLLYDFFQEHTDEFKDR